MIFSLVLEFLFAIYIPNIWSKICEMLKMNSGQHGVFGEIFWGAKMFRQGKTKQTHNLDLSSTLRILPSSKLLRLGNEMKNISPFSFALLSTFRNFTSNTLCED